MIKKLLSLTLFFILVQISKGQTTHISPTGDGGFESGTTFAANGWTATTSATTTNNQWVCNIGATGYTGARAAYVTNNTAGTPEPPHAYNNGVTAISHIYRNITISASEPNITLNFDWKCRGENSYDKMQVWLVPISYSPVYGSKITSNGTSPTGRIQLGGDYSAVTPWTNTTLAIPAAYAGTTFRIVFEWSNDGSVGTNPPIAIDNISLVSYIYTSYCTPSPTSVDGQGITNVSFGTVNNTTGAETGNYGNYSTQVGTALEGTTLPVNITYSTGYTYDTTIWVD